MNTRLSTIPGIPPPLLVREMEHVVELQATEELATEPIAEPAAMVATIPVPTISPAHQSPILLPAHQSPALAITPVTPPALQPPVPALLPVDLPIHQTHVTAISSAASPAHQPSVPATLPAPPAYNIDDAQGSAVEQHMGRHWYLVTKGLQTGVFLSW